MSLQDEQKILTRDARGMTGIRPEWNASEKNTCLLAGWIVSFSSITTCSFTKESCTVVSPQYIVNQANELFIDIATETRHCATLPGKTCDNTFVLFVAYELYKRRTVEIFHSISHLSNKFFKRREIIHFSKDQAYEYIIVGLNASRYCGSVFSFPYIIIIAQQLVLPIN